MTHHCRLSLALFVSFSWFSSLVLLVLLVVIYHYLPL